MKCRQTWAQRVFEDSSLSSTSSQATTRQDRLCSPVLALFSVGFFRRKFGNYCPTSTWWTGSGAHSTGKHSFSWQPATPVGEAAVVTPAWQSMLHTESLTRTLAFILSALPPLSVWLCVSLSPRCPFATSWGGKRGNGEGARQRSGVSPSPSASPQPSLLFAPVSGMSRHCTRGVLAPLAKPIDPLITCSPFSEKQVCACRAYVCAEPSVDRSNSLLFILTFPVLK